MLTAIVFKIDGNTCVTIPSQNCGLTLSQIADKDVPFGVGYKFIDISEISDDPVERNAMVLTDFDGYGNGGEL